MASNANNDKPEDADESFSLRRLFSSVRLSSKKASNQSRNESTPDDASNVLKSSKSFRKSAEKKIESIKKMTPRSLFPSIDSFPRVGKSRGHLVELDFSKGGTRNRDESRNEKSSLNQLNVEASSYKVKFKNLKEYWERKLASNEVGSGWSCEDLQNRGSSSNIAEWIVTKGRFGSKRSDSSEVASLVKKGAHKPIYQDLIKSEILEDGKIQTIRPRRQKQTDTNKPQSFTRGASVGRIRSQDLSRSADVTGVRLRSSSRSSVACRNPVKDLERGGNGSGIDRDVDVGVRSLSGFDRGVGARSLSGFDRGVGARSPSCFDRGFGARSPSGFDRGFGARSPSGFDRGFGARSPSDFDGGVDGGGQNFSHFDKVDDFNERLVESMVRIQPQEYATDTYLRIDNHKERVAYAYQHGSHPRELVTFRKRKSSTDAQKQDDPREYLYEAHHQGARPRVSSRDGNLYEIPPKWTRRNANEPVSPFQWSSRNANIPEYPLRCSNRNDIASQYDLRGCSKVSKVPNIPPRLSSRGRQPIQTDELSAKDARNDVLVFNDPPFITEVTVPLNEGKIKSTNDQQDLRTGRSRKRRLSRSKRSASCRIERLAANDSSPSDESSVALQQNPAVSLNDFDSRSDQSDPHVIMLKFLMNLPYDPNCSKEFASTIKNGTRRILLSLLRFDENVQNLSAYDNVDGSGNSLIQNEGRAADARIPTSPRSPPRENLDNVAGLPESSNRKKRRQRKKTQKRKE